jgi:hypothetical protein
MRITALILTTITFFLLAGNYGAAFGYLDLLTFFG